MPCLLCIDNLNPEDILFSNEYCLFLLRPSSNLEGAGLILPKIHRETLFDMLPKELASTFSLLKVVKLFLDKQYSPQGFTFGWDCGKTAGQLVNHAHFHVLPRYKDEPYCGKGMAHWPEKDENRRRPPEEENEFLKNLTEFLNI